MRTVALTAVIFITGFAVAAPNADLDAALAKAAAFEYGESRDALYEIRDFINASMGDAARLREIESRLAALLDSGATIAGKDFACRQLALIGTEASVPSLARLLARTETIDMALFALARIPGRAAGDALAAALKSVSGKPQVAVINAIGARREAKPVPALSSLISAGDQAVATAAIAALAEIGGGPALSALAGARARTKGVLHLRASEAYLRCAATAEPGAALRAYKEVLAAREPPAIHSAALAGISARGGKEAIPTLAAHLSSKEPHIQAAAVRLLRNTSGAETTRIFLEQLPKLAPAGQVRVITALADRGDMSARPALVAAVEARPAEVRAAALAGLAKVGTRADLSLLAEAAATRSGAEQAAARESVYTLRGADVDAAIVAALDTTTGAVRAEYIRAVGERAIFKAAGTLLAMAARDPDRSVRREALRALRSVGREEHVPALLNLVLEARGAADRREAAQMLATVLRRSDTPRTEVLETAYNNAQSSEARTAVLSVMGQASWDATLPLMRGALKDADPEVRRAAILALSEWVTPVPMQDLFDAAKSMSLETHRILALRGYLRLLGIQANRTTPESVRLVSEAIPLAKAPEEKKAILSLLTRYSSEESLVLVQKMLGDPEVAAEAKLAVEWINTQLEFSRPLRYKR